MAHLRLLAVDVVVLAGILIAIEGVAGCGCFIRGYASALLDDFAILSTAEASSLFIREGELDLPASAE